MDHRLAWLVYALACAVPGCTRTNPAFDGGLDDGGSASLGEASTASVTSLEPATSDASAAVTEGGSATSEDPPHEIAAGLSGVVVVLIEAAGSGLIAAAGLPPESHVIARSPFEGTPPVVFAIEEGAPLLGDGFAPARRVGMGFDADALGAPNGDLSEGGQSMFVAAVQWAML